MKSRYTRKQIEEAIKYWTARLNDMERRAINEQVDNVMITDQLIDDSTVQEWSCFIDENVVKLIDQLEKGVSVKESVCESRDVPNGREWQKMRFHAKLTDWAFPRRNIDGSRKGWFELPVFPTKTLKAADVTAKLIRKIHDDGYNVQVDFSGASPKLRNHVTTILNKTLERQFAREYDGLANDVGTAAGTAVSFAARPFLGTEGAVASGLATKAAMTGRGDEVVRKFNAEVSGTQYEALKLTNDDLNRNWFEKLLAYVISHPTITVAAVIAIVAMYKSRYWIWNRLKLGFNNLWQGTVIARYRFSLVDGTPLVFEYDLRFNKWRLLYDGFQWKDSAYPSEIMVKSFIKTQHCAKFIQKCAERIDFWFEHEKEIRQVLKMNENAKYKKSIDLIKDVLDDKNDILASFRQLRYKVG